MDVKNLSDVPAFITKDGSEIRELLAHRNSAIRNQSLAEARVPVAGSTQEHYHPKAEEIYYIRAMYLTPADLNRSPVRRVLCGDRPISGDKCWKSPAVLTRTGILASTK